MLIYKKVYRNIDIQYIKKLLTFKNYLTFKNNIKINFNFIYF